MKKITFINIFFLFTAAAWSQETVPELEIEKEYRIIGRDTRVFSITGDRESTVEFNPVTLKLVEEKRNIKSPEGLIRENERLLRKESFEVIKGFYSQLDYFFGAHTTNNVFGKASFDIDNMAATVKLLNRSSEENTPDNTAPLSQEIEATGYYDASGANYSLALGFSREDDDALNRNLRPGSHEVNRYRAVITIKPSILKAWNMAGQFSMKGGTFMNYEKPTAISILIDKDELVFVGGFSLSRHSTNFTATNKTNVEYIKLGGDIGTLISTGITGDWLFMNVLGIGAGADFYVFAMPAENTEVKVYPKLNMDWAITPDIFVKLKYKPGIITHSFSDIYGNNGLVTIKTPMLFENRKVDFEGEFGFRSRSGLSTSLGGFFMKAKHPPVYNRSGDFFDVVQDAEIELSGFRLTTSYNRNDILEVNGLINLNKVTWNFSGHAPYIPSIEAYLDGYFIPRRFWKLRASLRFTGEHYVEINKDDIEDSFVTIDLGVDRELWKQYISLYLDLRNITNSKGSWWTDTYQIPEIGLYIGIKAHY